MQAALAQDLEVELRSQHYLGYFFLVLSLECLNSVPSFIQRFVRIIGNYTHKLVAEYLAIAVLRLLMLKREITRNSL